jgi:hypothetical protein
MAGSFGFETGEKYDVSQRCGERVLLPKVREASARNIVIADGFSCRTQIEQNTQRRALHTAEVVHMAMRDTPPADYPERLYPQPAAKLSRKVVLVGLIGVGALFFYCATKSSER